MRHIAFIDTEIDPKNRKVLDIGSVREDGGQFRSGTPSGLIDFLQGSEYVCGHNIINHDLKYIGDAVRQAGITEFIDTLYMSPLMFPARPYHKLLKDDKLQTDDINNPLNDSIKARDLFYDEVEAFRRTDDALKEIYFLLLKDHREFRSFFRYVGYGENHEGAQHEGRSREIQHEGRSRETDNSHEPDAASAAPHAPGRQQAEDIETLIHTRFLFKMCENAKLTDMIRDNPVELAYCLALINTGDRYSITPPWVLKNYPAVDRLMYILRERPCITGCAYCNEALDIYSGLQNFFGYDSFRTYAGVPLQEQAVRAAIEQKSLLAIFPTGGGKSITFQLPALMSGINTRGLTVVISPLQSLMKDQVDNLEKFNITEAVTINGLLDPIERAKAIERVENGSACILYIAPESLRSKTVENLLLGRKVVRFVIDEAHCFSAWGHDFRVDYLYIGDFIKNLQEKKNLDEPIPVSCFTATAKQKVIEDIKEYFRERLSIEMQVFTSDAVRTNLHYKVFPRETDEEKYNTIRDLLSENDCPAIIYVSRTKRAHDLAKRLTDDGFEARAYHGQMDRRERIENQNAFMNGEVRTMVATSAFGMGVDKKDVGMVIHYEISDSLENYVQEAGRAGRDESVDADCYVLFNDEDLNKHFILLNQTKLSIKEIQQIWRAIKNITKQRMRVSRSALEIARQAGWDDNVRDIETKVRTAILALEEAGFLKREQNVPRVYATGILADNAAEAIERINASPGLNEKQKENAARIIKKLISAKHWKTAVGEEPESRVDYISDHLGIPKETVIEIIYLLRDEKILADTKDMTAYIKKKKPGNDSLDILKAHVQIENFLLGIYKNRAETYNIKKLNEQAILDGCTESTMPRLKTIINIWSITKWVKRHYDTRSNVHLKLRGLIDREALQAKLIKRHELAQFIIEYLYRKYSDIKDDADATKGREEIPVEFSVMELRQAFGSEIRLFSTEASLAEVEDALFYLSRIGAMDLEGGFFVKYNAMMIERLETNNKRQYKLEDYQKLEQFYQNKIQQVHIVGEYARKMMEDYQAALQFVDDYFKLNYSSFLNKYFRGRQEEIRNSITPEKFRRLFLELKPTQLKIVKDKDSKYIVVAAGPGSGKTRILVHKLTSLLLMEDVKHEQLLMLTFSRSAATVFKKRLLKLYGNAANYVEIKTFHSYCFDLLGRPGTLEGSNNIIREAVDRIRRGETERSRITKTVLVIDEAQDMDGDEYELVCALMEQNEEMRIIAVGDDDQNIFAFRGSSSEYMEKLITEKNAVVYELAENHRSKANIVGFTNEIAKKISHRLKRTPIIPVQKDNGIIKIVRYKCNHLVTPLVDDIMSTGLSGTTCVLTATNDEAVKVAGLLVNRGMPAKLIQSDEGLRLYDLQEVRYFLGLLEMDGAYGSAQDNSVTTTAFTAGRPETQPGEQIPPSPVICADAWEEAKRKLKDKFGASHRQSSGHNLSGSCGSDGSHNPSGGLITGSWRPGTVVNPNLELCMNMIKSFEEANPKLKYRSDLETFIRESRLEDFYEEHGETILVSTMHKAKGREFDNVFIMLDGYRLDSDEAVRVLYVAATRAKQRLVIHYNGYYLNRINAAGIEYIEDKGTYHPPAHLAVQLTHRDVWLDYFYSVRHTVEQMQSGDTLTVGDGCCLNAAGQVVVRFSRKFAADVEKMKQRGYRPVSAAIRFIVHWKNDEAEDEALVILPLIVFEKDES
jgi:ATP-dependent DNA helicase RecQ